MQLFRRELYAFIVAFCVTACGLAQVTTERVPDGGLAPQAQVDSLGHLHLIYFRGDPSHGDIFYVRSNDAGGSFSKPVRVNSQPNSALIIGTVRCPQIALGREGRVHVAWMGSGVALPKAQVGDAGNSAPMLYSRLNEKENTFEL